MSAIKGTPAFSITCSVAPVADGAPQSVELAEENARLKEQVAKLEDAVWSKEVETKILTTIADFASFFRIESSTMSIKKLDKIIKGGGIVNKTDSQLRDLSEEPTDAEVIIYDTVGNTRGLIRLPVNNVTLEGYSHAAIHCNNGLTLAPGSHPNRWIAKLSNHTALVNVDGKAFPVDYVVLLK